MNKNTIKTHKNTGGGVEITKSKRVTVKDAIKQYYGDEYIYSEYADEAEKILKQLDHEKIKNKCIREAVNHEKKIWHIGRKAVNKVACILAASFIITVLCGFGYAVVSGYIDSIKVKDKEDHSEIEIRYIDNIDWDEETQILTRIEKYYEPTWIPEEYYVLSEAKDSSVNSIIYESSQKGYRIVYHQTVSKVNQYFNSIDGKHEKIEFGNFSGEFIETEKSNYLIVTDGVYLYDLVADNMEKDTLIKMLNSIE